MTTVVVATNNAKKLKEIREILASVAPGVAILTAADIALGEPEENGETFRANALIKALAAFDKSGAISLADDSGLEVDALGGAPGVHSARYSGPDANDDRNNQKLLAALAAVPDALRTARYRCAIALVAPAPFEGAEAIVGGRGPAWAVIVDGACEGRVLRAPSGSGGFGYDPYMLYEPAGMTFADLPADEKHRVSHRGQALRALDPYLRRVLARGTAQGEPSCGAKAASIASSGPTTR